MIWIDRSPCFTVRAFLVSEGMLKGANQVITYRLSKGTEERPFDVQIIVNGVFTGNGMFCKSMQEVEQYLKSFGISTKSRDR